LGEHGGQRSRPVEPRAREDQVVIRCEHLKTQLLGGSHIGQETIQRPMLIIEGN
jgi:hypothetical protein